MGTSRVICRLSRAINSFPRSHRALAVRIGVFRGKLYLLAGLRKKFLRLGRMTAEIVVIVFLRFVNFLPRLLDQLLSGAHVPVLLTDIYAWLLRKRDDAQR